MSLKKSLKKSIAAFMALSIVSSNCYLCGIGLSKVIAEEVTDLSLEINFENLQYVQYSTEDYSGVVIQTKLQLSTNQNEETYLPVKDAQISLNLPDINGKYPVDVKVVDSDTLLSTGELNNDKVNQNYDANSGLLKVSYENEETYSTYVEGAIDEFEIIYIYPTEAYTGNEEEISLRYTVNAEMSFANEKTQASATRTKTFPILEKENRGDIATFDVAKPEGEIYKGFMYSNVENETSYETEYKTVSTLSVLNKDLVTEEFITMELLESKFVLNDEEETQVSSNGNIVYKSTKISKYEFDRMLGQNGTIEIYGNGNEFATIKYSEIDGENKLSIIEPDGKVNPLEDLEETITITYSGNISSLTIKISKPITEGTIHFENQNAIKASDDYGTDAQNIKYISIESTLNEVSNNTKIELLEPETKISAKLSNSNFSTLQTNKTTLTITLDSTDASTKLFNSPVIKVKLPEGLTRGTLSSPRIANGNGLEISEENVTVENNIITINVQGKQASYDLTNVSGGASIVMDIENLDFEDTLPTHEDKIEVICRQSEETVSTECKVNIVSKEGLLMSSTLSNFDEKNTILSTTDNEQKIANISETASEKEAVHELVLVNNYDENLTNVQIIGRLEYSNSELNSTFATELTKEVEVNNENAEIYYSTNKDASYEDESWTEEFTSHARAYKVVLEDNALSTLGNIQIKANIKIPENLGYNQETYMSHNVAYNYNENVMQDETIFGLKTDKKDEENELISVTLTTPEDELPEEFKYDVIYKENNMVEYRVRVKNISQDKLENVKVQFGRPNGLVYEEGGLGIYDVFEGFSIVNLGTINNDVFEYNIREIQPNEEKVVVIRYRVTKTENTYNPSVDGIANVYVGEYEYKSNIKTIELSLAEFKITTEVNAKEIDILKKGDTVVYTIKVENIGKSARAFNVETTIPNEIEVRQIEYSVNGGSKQVISTNNQNIQVPNSLEKDEELTIKITGKIKEIESENDTVLEITNNASLVIGEYKITSNNATFKLQPEIKVVEGETPKDDEGSNPEDETPTEGEDNTPGDETPTEATLYTVLGVAWIDANKDGKKDENEKLQDSVVVSLVDMSIGNFALDANGNRITTITNSEGKYTFNNIPKGTYIVLFEFDTNTYTVTTYQKEQVGENINSDAILSTVTIDGNKKAAALTDNIVVDSNKENIDIGLMEKAIFDLSLDKKITKITVTNSKGTESYEYENGETAKVDLVAKYMAGSKVTVNYKFTVFNEGDVTGYVNSLVDNLPEGLDFNSEINKDWYKGNDGKLYTTALSKVAIKPGESAEIELVLTKNMTEENAGIFPNSAKLDKISNLENIQEKETAIDNNQASATLIISIKTGAIAMYIGITVICLAIICAGTYLIKKKVLNKGI